MSVTHLRTRLQAWFAQQPGASLLQIEQDWLAQQLPDMFGYHILQLGQLADMDLLAASRIGHRAVLALDAVDGQQPAVVSRGESLPLAADSVDVLVLPHVLEFEVNPHQVLRECERVLIGEGHVLILTFNPWSLWGLSRLLLGWRAAPPWNGHFFSASRLQDWLRLLGFEILTTQRLFYRPPIVHTATLQRLVFMEQLGPWCWPWWAGVHAIVAKKRVIPLTPVRELWRRRRRLIANGIAEPTARKKQPTGTLTS
ncbi:SAM-dependent methyltransferase [Methylohalomonas lacus]|uniref:SAM-dependent methyltransferase n=1 Tax=Methylohalomonas lacus TaxID=398773 RepID=A0AAE3HJI1_9GAMM|nr:class I SAM-dependent methyltransferase [Methylohalomonas lacus]MCS3903516.1 SAM-dependent methyltransferase [Methylohalomonas lacus]